MKNRLSYCGIIITHADRYFFSKYNKNCRRDCACKTISPQGTVLRIGFLLTAILSSTPYCIPIEGLRRELFGDGRISAQEAQVAEHERTVGCKYDVERVHPCPSHLDVLSIRVRCAQKVTADLHVFFCRF